MRSSSEAARLRAYEYISRTECDGLCFGEASARDEDALRHSASRDTARLTVTRLAKNQPTGRCPYGYANWCLAREIVKTVKTARQRWHHSPQRSRRTSSRPTSRRPPRRGSATATAQERARARRAPRCGASSARRRIPGRGGGPAAAAAARARAAAGRRRRRRRCWRRRSARRRRWRQRDLHPRVSRGFTISALMLFVSSI